ncbi:MAG: hypothetical protein IT450_04725 [Phycisphaerales bacterium]|nr:hypothetical protein [Phycisphaerales bacterium]
MPMSLTDPRWRELRGSYGGVDDILTWLAEAYQVGRLSETRLSDLVNEVQHQGGTSTAMYAVAVHLIELARRSSPRDALALLTHAGFIYARSRDSDAAPCPSFLSDEFNATAPVGATMLSPLLALATDFDSYKGAVAGLAGFIGLHGFTRFLDGLDYYEGKFFHQLIGGPFPEE